MFDGNQGGCTPRVHHSSAPLSLAPCSHLSRLRNQVSLFSEVRRFPALKGSSSFMHLSLSDMLGFFYSFLSWSLFITSLNRSRYSQSEKASLDPSASSSYHPISQLPLPAKFLEFMPSKFCCVFLHLPFLNPLNLAFDSLPLKTFLKGLLGCGWWLWPFC